MHIVNTAVTAGR